jgi:hypothetical protein
MARDCGAGIAPRRPTIALATADTTNTMRALQRIATVHDGPLTSSASSQQRYTEGGHEIEVRNDADADRSKQQRQVGQEGTMRMHNAWPATHEAFIRAPADRFREVR